MYSRKLGRGVTEASSCGNADTEGSTKGTLWALEKDRAQDNSRSGHTLSEQQREHREPLVRRAQPTTPDGRHELNLRFKEAQSAPLRFLWQGDSRLPSMHGRPSYHDQLARVAIARPCGGLLAVAQREAGGGGGAGLQVAQAGGGLPNEVVPAAAVPVQHAHRQRPLQVRVAQVLQRDVNGGPRRVEGVVLHLRLHEKRAAAMR
jgi:hypothetical protein